MMPVHPTSASASNHPLPPPATLLRTLLFTVTLEGPVAMIAYDVPGESVNTLRQETAAELAKVLAVVQETPAVQAAVLVSGKPDSFIAGADIELLGHVPSREDACALSLDAQRMLHALATLSKPVVAAVHGACLGGGFEVALACHGRVATSAEKTVFALPEVQLGLVPGGNGLLRLAHLVGIATALDLGLTGRKISAAQSKRMGIVDEVVPVTILRDVAKARALALATPAEKKTSKAKGLSLVTVQRWLLEQNAVGQSVLFRKARATIQKKGGAHYPALGRVVRIVETYTRRGWEAAAAEEMRSFGDLVMSETAKRLIEIFFATHELKKDSGVDDVSVRAHPVEKVVVLGAGLMGAGITYLTLDAGVAVRWRDKDDRALDRGLRYVADRYRSRVKRGRLTLAEQAKKTALLTSTTELVGIAKADVVIEAVFENLELKQQVLREIEAVTGPTTVFASNTSSIPIASIAAASSRPAQVVGMHYFSPAEKMPLLEVIRTNETAPWVVATAVALGKAQGKTVIVVKDGAGFYTSRILAPYLNEAAHLLTEGVAVDEVDRALVAWGWPVGPLTLLDEIGIDVALHVGPVLQAALGERIAPPPAFAKLLRDDRKGRKSGRGLYLYGESLQKYRLRSPFRLHQRKVVDASVYAVLGVSSLSHQISTETIQLRCSLQFLNEAVHCFGEGLLRCPRDGDIGAVFGLGFPPFLGGPFRYVDTLGVAKILAQIQTYEQRLGLRWTPAPLLVEMAKTNRKFYPA